MASSYTPEVQAEALAEAAQLATLRALARAMLDAYDDRPYLSYGAGSGLDALQSVLFAEWTYRHGLPPMSAAPKRPRPRPPSSAETLALLRIACVKCGSRDRVVLDHIVPIVAGGTLAPENVQPLCWTCNSSKAGRVA